MANHNLASSSSQKLCDLLLNALNHKIGGIKCEHQSNKCKIYGPGKAFAWVNSHSCRSAKLNIWFLGSAEDAKKFSGLIIKPRGKPENAGAWGAWEGSFNIINESQIAQAANLLSEISYPRSV